MGWRHPRTLTASATVLIAAIGARGQSLAPTNDAEGAHPRATVALIDHALAETDAELARLEAEERRLGVESEGLPERARAVRDRARRESRRLYHLEQGSLLALRGGPGALLDHLARKAHARRALRSSLRELETITARSTEITDARARIERDKRAARERRAELAARRQQAELFGARGTLGVTAVAPSPLGEPVTVYGGRGGDSAATRFADAAGALLLPIAGRAELRPVHREGAEGPGVEVRAALGAPVRAVFAGRVAFSDRYGSLGRLVILDHGEHYYTVSANLGTVAVRVGEELPAGAVLGTVGDDGSGPMLYFEVRHGSETIDPMPWFGLRAQ